MPRPKPTFDSFSHLFSGLNYTIASEEFNVNTKIHITCNVGHVYQTSITKIKSLHHNPNICPHCQRIAKNEKLGISYECLNRKVTSMGFILLDKKPFYHKEKSTIKIQCLYDDYIHEIKCIGHFIDNTNIIKCPLCNVPKNIIENLTEKNDEIKFSPNNIKLIAPVDIDSLPPSLSNKIRSQKKWNLIEYINTKNAAKYQCIDCGHIKTTLPFNIFAGRGSGCKGCVKNVTNFRIYDKIRSICNTYGLYVSSQFTYETIDSIIHFTCNTCGEHFDNTWAEVVGKYYKVTCPHCFKDTKRKEQSEVYTFVKSLCDTASHEDNVIIAPLQLDIVCHEEKVAIEYSGVIWHSTKYKKESLYHRNKMNECKKHGYRFIMIFDDEWNDKRSICESRIRSILGKSNIQIYARKCEIKSIDSVTARSFCDSNHIQGSPVSCDISYGLFYENNLVSCMIFNQRKGKIKSENSWELVRYCCLLNHSVIGSASRLLAKFRDEYKNVVIVTFSDLRWGDTDFYTKIGFTEDSTIPVDYTYAGNGTQWKRRHKFGFDKKRLIRMASKRGIVVLPDDTETTLSEKMGLYKVYDCGHKRYKMIT